MYFNDEPLEYCKKMTKEDRIEEMEKQLAALKIEIKERSAGPLFIPNDGDDMYILGRYGAQIKAQYKKARGPYTIPQFRKESTAKAFAEAINIWFEWNRCEGRVDPDTGRGSWVADWEGDGSYDIMNDMGKSRLSPSFDTEANCQASIDKIGKDRIEACRKGLHLMG